MPPPPTVTSRASNGPGRGRGARLLAGAALLVLGATLSGCSGSDPADQTAVRQALLTAGELPGQGWTLVEATERIPTRAAEVAPLSQDSACNTALTTLDTLESGATSFARGSYAASNQPLLELTVQSFQAIPPSIRDLPQIVEACPGGTLDQAGTSMPFELTSPEYPDSGSVGARLTVTTPDGPQAMDVAVLVRGNTVIVGSASGTDPATPPTLLDQAVSAQEKKAEDLGAF